MWAAPRRFELRRLLILIVMTLAAGGMSARTFLSQDEALKLAFPGNVKLERQSLFLSEPERSRAESLSGVEFDDELVVRYVAQRDGKVIGYAYFDAHRVRTLPETIMIVLTADARIERIEILSFSEPLDYLPKERWLDQLDGRRLVEELLLTRAIRPISGAKLSGRAIVKASRKMLAIHEVVEARGGKK